MLISIWAMSLSWVQALVLLHTQPGHYQYPIIINQTTIFLGRNLFNVFSLNTLSLRYTNSLYNVNFISVSKSGVSVLACDNLGDKNEVRLYVYDGSAYNELEQHASDCCVPYIQPSGLVLYFTLNSYIHVYERNNEQATWEVSDSIAASVDSVSGWESNSKYLLGFIYTRSSVIVYIDYGLQDQRQYSISVAGHIYQIKFRQQLAYLVTSINVEVYDLEKQNRIGTINNVQNSYSSITFSDNLDFIVTCQYQDNIHFFDSPAGNLIDQFPNPCAFLDSNDQILAIGSPSGLFIYCRHFKYQETCVQECPEQTQTINNQCFVCLWDYHDKQCVTLCRDDQYIEYSDYTCRNCQNICLRCNAQGCTSCKASLFVYQGNCLSTCPVRTTNQQYICIPCPNFYYPTTQNCVDECPLLTYSIPNKDCLLCITPCVECQSEVACVTCINGLSLYQASCISECPVRHYQTREKICLYCNEYCISCSDFRNCLTCQREMYLHDGKCVEYCEYCVISGIKTNFFTLFSDKVLTLNWNWDISNASIIAGMHILNDQQYQLHIESQQLSFTWKCTHSYNTTGSTFRVFVMAGITPISFQTGVDFVCLQKSTSLGSSSLEAVQPAVLAMKNSSFLYTYFVQYLLPGTIPSLTLLYRKIQLPIPILDFLWLGSTPFFYNPPTSTLYCSTILFLTSFLLSLGMTLLIIYQHLLSLPQSFLSVCLLTCDFFQGTYLQMMLIIIHENIRNEVYTLYETLPFMIGPLLYFFVRNWRLRMMLRLELPSNHHHWMLFSEFVVGLTFLKFKPISPTLESRETNWGFDCSQTYLLLLGIDLTIINSCLFEEWWLSLSLALFPCLLTILLIICIRPFKDIVLFCIAILKYIVLTGMIISLTFLQRNQQIVFEEGGSADIGVLIWAVVILFGVNVVLAIITYFYVLIVMMGKNFRSDVVKQMKKWYLQMLVQDKYLLKKNVRQLIIEANLNQLCIESLPDATTQILTISSDMMIKQVTHIKFNDASNFCIYNNFKKKWTIKKAQSYERKVVVECIEKLIKEREIQCEGMADEIRISQLIKQSECQVGQIIPVLPHTIQLRWGMTVIKFNRVPLQIFQLFFNNNNNDNI